MNIVQLYELGRRGYRHLKCFEHLSCEAAVPLKLTYPGILDLSSFANRAAAEMLAQDLKHGVLGLDVTEAEANRLESLLPDELHAFYLSCEEIIDRCSDEAMPVWDSEDLAAELEEWLRIDHD